LHPKVRLIWGDGLDIFKIRKILSKMEDEDWSADNISFGMGGGLLQNVNRDTQSFAFKASSAIIDGKQRDVRKNPITDNNKVSKAGYQSLYMKDGVMKTINKKDMANDILREVYVDGKFKNLQNLASIRNLSNEGLDL
jgi:nicotinamide phosphoribosyltransferase